MPRQENIEALQQAALRFKMRDLEDRAGGCVFHATAVQFCGESG
jgi:hypothetical protein